MNFNFAEINKKKLLEFIRIEFVNLELGIFKIQVDITLVKSDQFISHWF